METTRGNWELTILDALPALSRGLCSLTAGDLDGDGNVEVVTGSRALLWYRPRTFQRGVIAVAREKSHFVVGLTLEDLDGDGIMEVVASEEDPHMLTWFKPEKGLDQLWTRYVLDPARTAGAHDLVFADVDGDGERELVANAVQDPGLAIYKRTADLTAPWSKHTVQAGAFEEGLAVGDLDGDGRLEIVSGPNWYAAPAGGAYAGPWQRRSIAPSFREQCRVALIDITGNGRPDVVMAESEYTDGRLAWFENRIVEDAEHPWVEHEIDRGLVYGHSLAAWREEGAGQVCVFVGEMAQGGYGAAFNHDARVMLYVTSDRSRTWRREVGDQGEGTHEATACDVDGDGQVEFVGKRLRDTVVQLWKPRPAPSPLLRFRHRFLDRDKPHTACDILAVDVDGDGRPDVACGEWWYRNPTWERYHIPGIYQVVNAYDLDGDGRQEIIGLKELPTTAQDWYQRMSGDMVWLKPIDPMAGEWEEYAIGTGSGGWPHGTGIGPLLPGGRLALVATYHGGGRPLFTLDLGLQADLDGEAVTKRLQEAFAQNGRPLSPEASIEKMGQRWSITDQENRFRYGIGVAGDALAVRGSYPEIFEVPDDPRQGPWPVRVLAEIRHGEEFVPYDIDGDGRLDLLAGNYWLQNTGDGNFRPHRFMAEELNFRAARFRVMDVNGDGRPDVVAVEEDLDYPTQTCFFARVAWFENPGDPWQGPWKMHMIDAIRSPHSLDTADLDGDGELELVVGEHNPFLAYRSRSRLFVYKQADARGRAWRRYELDGRFEHHCGTRVFQVAPGRWAIASHGWKDSRYVHLWEQY